MKRQKYELRLHALAALFGIASCGIPAGLYFITHDWRHSAVSFGGNCLLCLLAYLIYRLDDAYISGIVSDLSNLVDVLTELEEREVFSGEEDTLLSKLQSKVIKLARILKHKNQVAKQGQENMKELVSDISHQLKTPIANLKMYSSFLEDDGLSEEHRREYVGIVRLSVERLDFLSENLIKISRLESGLIHLDMRSQSLSETVLRAVKDIYPKAKKRGVEIAYREEGEFVLRHDRNWTAEAVFNLLDNGVKYAREGSRVVLAIRKLGSFAEVSVEDENGPIPEGERTKIFTRFYRGENSRNQEGIGVGLYLSREIAVRQGGYMNLRTTEKGNVFCIVVRK